MKVWRSGQIWITVFMLFAISARCETSPLKSAPQEETVVFFSGGTVDDHVVSVLLFTMDNVRFLGSLTSNSDCIYRFSMQSQWRLQSILNKQAYPITLSNARAWNPFPMDYREDALDIYHSDVLKEKRDNTTWPPYPDGETFLAQKLAQAIEDDTPLTLLVTSPITPLCSVLKQDKSLEKGIKKVIWMGGAIHVPGNLDPQTLPKKIANPKAEWNAFWDPYAVDWIFKNTSFPLIVFPLDVTNQAKLTRDFMQQLEAQAEKYEYSSLVGGIYNLIADEPYFEMWNTLTSVYLARPDLFEAPISMKLGIETEGYMQGAITPLTGGRKAEVVFDISDTQGFYDYVLKQLRRDIKTEKTTTSASVQKP